MSNLLISDWSQFIIPQLYWNTGTASWFMALILFLGVFFFSPRSMQVFFGNCVASFYDIVGGSFQLHGICKMLHCLAPVLLYLGLLSCQN